MLLWRNLPKSWPFKVQLSGMNFLYSVFFGAGVAAFAYTKMGRRLGYANTQNVTIVTAVVFVLATIFFYTLIAVVLNIH